MVVSNSEGSILGATITWGSVAFCSDEIPAYPTLLYKLMQLLLYLAYIGTFVVVNHALHKQTLAALINNYSL